MAQEMQQELVALQTGKSYEVVVVGGGIAGVSAAVAASRQGKRVLLLEKASYLGGLATLGLVVLRRGKPRGRPVSDRFQRPGLCSGAE